MLDVNAFRLSKMRIQNFSQLIKKILTHSSPLIMVQLSVVPTIIVVGSTPTSGVVKALKSALYFQYYIN